MKRLAARIKTEAAMDHYFNKLHISKREKEIIHLLLKGKSNKEIEDELFISLGTVKNHVYRIFQKLEVKNRTSTGRPVQEYPDQIDFRAGPIESGSKSSVFPAIKKKFSVDSRLRICVVLRYNTTFMSRPLLHLTLILLMALSCACSKRPPIENVLLVSLDSTRADYVDSGLGARAWTPELRRFASGSWVFANAYSPIPQTLPAHLAVLSGRPPHELGVFGNEQVYDGRYPSAAAGAAAPWLANLRDRLAGHAGGRDRHRPRIRPLSRPDE